MKKVSVPCRGTAFLNNNSNNLRIGDWFPSPVGELHFSMVETQHVESVTVSVPCRGTAFLNTTITLTIKITEEFPSPVGELHFSMKMKAVKGYTKHDCFRPLSGNCISQFFSQEDLIKELGLCFRPLSGNCISQYHPCNPATSLGSWAGLRGKNIF